MKTNWQIKKLGEICDFEGGSQPPKSKFIHTPKSGYVRFLQIRDFKSDKNITYIPESKKNRLCTKEDILIGRYGASVGQILTNEEGAYNVALMKTISNKDVLEKDFFYYYLISDEFQTRLAKVSARLAQAGFSKDDIYNFPVIIPPLPEQKRIIKILDEAFRKIEKAKENAEKNLKNLKELFESYLQGIFENSGKDWEEKKIGEICDLMTGGTPSRNKKEYFENGKVRWLVSGDVNLEEIFDCEGRITELGMKNSNAKYLPVDSVIIALNGQGKTRGTVAILRIEATCNQSLVSIYPKKSKEIISEYIFFNLKVRYQEIRKITGDDGNDRRGLNMSLIRNITISFPKSIAKQEEIISDFKNLLKQTKKLEEVYKKKLADLEELKKSILNKAFTGEL